MGSIIAEITGLEQDPDAVIDAAYGTGNDNTLVIGEIGQDEEYIFGGQFIDGQTLSAYASITSGYNEWWIDNGAVSPWSLAYIDRIVSAVETPSCTVTHAGSTDGWCLGALKGPIAEAAAAGRSSLVPDLIPNT